MNLHFAAVMLLSAAAWAQAGDAPDAGAALSRLDGGAAGYATPEKSALNLALMPFTPDTVKRVVAYNRDKIQACYEETLASKTKPVEGRVMTSFVVTPEGLVKAPRVLKKGTTLKDPRLHACVVDALGTFTFPKPSDRREHPIEYPFNLKAVH
jgi:hypothetical protein